MRAKTDQAFSNRNEGTWRPGSLVRIGTESRLMNMGKLTDSDYSAICASASKIKISYTASQYKIKLIGWYSSNSIALNMTKSIEISSLFHFLTNELDSMPVCSVSKDMMHEFVTKLKCLELLMNVSIANLSSSKPCRRGHGLPEYRS